MSCQLINFKVKMDPVVGPVINRRRVINPPRVDYESAALSKTWHLARHPGDTATINLIEGVRTRARCVPIRARLSTCGGLLTRPGPIMNRPQVNNRAPQISRQG